MNITTKNSWINHIFSVNQISNQIFDYISNSPIGLFPLCAVHKIFHSRIWPFYTNISKTRKGKRKFEEIQKKKEIIPTSNKPTSPHHLYSSKLTHLVLNKNFIYTNMDQNNLLFKKLISILNKNNIHNLTISKEALLFIKQRTKESLSIMEYLCSILSQIKTLYLIDFSFSELYLLNTVLSNFGTNVKSVEKLILYSFEPEKYQNDRLHISIPRFLKLYYHNLNQIHFHLNSNYSNFPSLIQSAQEKLRLNTALHCQRFVEMKFSYSF